ncbi:hypothetical protein CCACVL1_04698 [Corchorus capsularis]|uniref:Uncharacterized protein n=1 Tax=Corchorus capsularis TaxID=210143 RepID=A0A1R3JQ89_COCAP|nr:hypothetical protein CCACVL1_04698 [Corchorus capsularis]
MWVIRISGHLTFGVLGRPKTNILLINAPEKGKLRYDGIYSCTSMFRKAAFMRSVPNLQQLYLWENDLSGNIPNSIYEV